MSLVETATTGLEEIQRQVFFKLFEDMNDTILVIAERMDTSDEEFATRTGRPYVQTVIEPVEPANFYEGHRPSLITAPIEDYPNVSVMATRSAPTPESDLLDHGASYRDSIIVEIMAKAIEDEETVNRRIHRLAQAAHVCLMRDQTLNGVVSGFDTTPSVAISDVFTRKEQTGYGPNWFWQGARLEYAVRKEAGHFPSSSSGSIFQSAPYEIDQV